MSHTSMREKRGFRLGVKHSFSPGSVCTEQLSGCTFLAFQRSALPGNQPTDFRHRLLNSQITDTTFMSPKGAAPPPDVACNILHESKPRLSFLESRQRQPPLPPTDRRGAEVASLSLSAVRVQVFFCCRGVSKPGFSCERREKSPINIITDTFKEFNDRRQQKVSRKVISMTARKQRRVSFGPRNKLTGLPASRTI